jgi:acetolactate synthase-1/2/3 large subunit
MNEFPIHHVLVRHEQGATHMADGFARASGKVGVAMATSGPGATNMVTGIATAQMDSSPIVCITGQVTSDLIGYDAFQETDVTGITLPITKHNYLVTDIHELGDIMREAFYIARSGRPGPVLVDIAKDVQISAIEWEYDSLPIQLPGYRPDLRPSSAEIQQAAEMIFAAERPLILVGQGVLLSGAVDELREFAEKTRTPVASTLLGIGALPASHPLNLGFLGMHGEAWVNHAIQQSDLILAMGLRFDDRVTGNTQLFAHNAKKIHFEIDPSEVNKNVQVDLALIGDLKETIHTLMPTIKSSDHSEWGEAINEMRGESALRDIQNWEDDGVLHGPHVIRDIRKYAGEETIVVSDVGQHQMWEAQYYRHEKPRSLITSGGLGTMGFAIPAAIGAKFANPNAEVWAIVGDGGFQMTQAELSTAAQEGIKIHVAVLNNGYLGMVRQLQEFFYKGNYVATPMLGPDFMKIADAHGLAGFRVTKREEIEDAVNKARQADGTVVIEFQVAQTDSVYPTVPAGADLNAMIRRPIAS